MAYTLTYTGQFKKDLKRCQKRGLDIELLHKVITLLQETVLCRLNINLIYCRDNFQDIGSVI